MKDLSVYSTITHRKSFYDDMIAQSSQLDVIPMEDLIAGHSGWKNSHGKTLGILTSTSAITSIISSSTLIWMIVRSDKGLSTTRHRLLLGLCISDIILSSGHSTFNTMVPSEIDYMVWNARGNKATCDAQGFILNLGGSGGLWYNTTLNLYFLAVVTFEKSDEEIRTKIEPFLHGVPILLGFVWSVSLLVKKHYNGSGGGSCYDSFYYPEHCVGYNVGEIRNGFEIPCGRGINGASSVQIFQKIFVVIPIIIIVTTLGMLYRTVKKQENKMGRYGIGSIRSNAVQHAEGITPHTQEQDTQQPTVWRRTSACLTTLSSSLRRKVTLSSATTRRSINKRRSYSRAVMHKAFAYSLAWLLSYGFYIIGSFLSLLGQGFPLALTYMKAIFLPLQGFFTLFIFIYPKVMSAKRSNRGNVSWREALKIAFWSRGEGEKKYTPARTSNLRRRNHNKKKNKSDANTETPQEIENLKSRRCQKSPEEEKTEIN